MVQGGVLLQDGLRSAFDAELDKVVERLPYTLSSSGAYTTACQSALDLAGGIPCSGLSAQKATYSVAGGYFHEVTMCTCEGGPYDANGLAALISGIPGFLIVFLNGERLMAGQTCV